MSRARKRPAAALQVSEDIVSVGDLQSNLVGKLRDLRQRRRPLIVTQNGKAAAVLLAPKEFDRLTREAQFVSAVEDGLADAAAQRIVSDTDLRRRLDARFGRLRAVRR